VLLGALRRFGILLGVASAGSALLGLLLTGALHEGIRRGLAIGFYLGGVGLLALGFLLGSRPPVRSPSGGFVGPFKWVGGGIRFATREEHLEAMNVPAIMLAIGVCLIGIGVAVDSRHG
jgi:hypothetical protein